MSLPSSMEYFVPCDRLLQKAYLFAQIVESVHKLLWSIVVQIFNDPRPRAVLYIVKIVPIAWEIFSDLRFADCKR